MCWRTRYTIIINCICTSTFFLLLYGFELNGCRNKALGITCNVVIWFGLNVSSTYRNTNDVLPTAPTRKYADQTKGWTNKLPIHKLLIQIIHIWSMNAIRIYLHQAKPLWNYILFVLFEPYAKLFLLFFLEKNWLLENLNHSRKFRLNVNFFI